MTTPAICFYNNGVLDKRAFTMLGLSAKADDSAIGFFGTGFKYAIACLLRNGASVQVYVRNPDTRDGYTLYTFFSVRGLFRDKEHDFIYYRQNSDITFNGIPIEYDAVELPFTTHLGTNWKLWQAYRELYTNALDEKGNVALTSDDTIETMQKLGDVVVCVSNCDDFMKVHQERDKYFLNVPTLSRSHYLRAVDKIDLSDNTVYYKTMYTGTKVDKPTYFTYDYIAKTALTEDRTLADAWSIGTHIVELWAEYMKYDMLVEHLPRIAKDEYYECGLSYIYGVPSNDFIRACAHLVEHHRPLPMWARDAYDKTLPFNSQVTKFKLNTLYKKQLEKAVNIMHMCDMQVDLSIVVCCVSLPENLAGMYRDGCIYISKTAFERGFHCLLGTLYEEWLHCTTGCEDRTRKMQNLLVDQVALLMERLHAVENEP